MNFTRRKFISGAALATVGIACGRTLERRRVIPGELCGANHKLGHRIRDGNFQTPKEDLRVPVVIVGAGISGLSAGRWLMRNDFKDFEILELEGRAGGNATSGRNAVTAYPHASHYLPAPGKELPELVNFLDESGFIESYDSGGNPQYSEYAICHSPQERVFYRGGWHEGLIPIQAISPTDRTQCHDFFRKMEEMSVERGRDGRLAFALPLDKSSRDEKYISLDLQNMRAYLIANGWDSQVLHWYVDYCCRDDYGTTSFETSAWAGIHYFSARKNPNTDSHGQQLLTWPEGNGRLTMELSKSLQAQVKCGNAVYNIGRLNNQLYVDYYRAAEDRTIRLKTDAIIYAAPRYTAFRIMECYRENLPIWKSGLSYAPWVVSNIEVNRDRLEDSSSMAWDNIVYGGSSLGYVNAHPSAT